jgi:ubiquinone/menaquinone biosynthesis C-methylase UbiE
MKEDWNDPDFARWWDERADTKPLRAEQLGVVLSLIQKTVRPGATILDLGAGSGRLEERLLELVPDAHVVAIDASQPMLALARDRLRGAGDRIVLLSGDFTALDAIAFPVSKYQIVVSSQALHHVPDEAKRSVFEAAYRLLERGGLLVIMDRVAVSRTDLRAVGRVVWNRLRGRRQHDHPATVATHLRLLRQAGFDATCVHALRNRAILTALKPAAEDTRSCRGC